MDSDSHLVGARIAHADVNVVAVRGELDMSNAETFRQVVADGLRGAEASSATALVVDLSAVTFMDSVALAALVDAHQTSAVPLRLVVASRAVRRIFDISGMSQVLDVHPTVDCAVGAAR